MHLLRLPIKATAILLTCSLFLTSCVSSTVINSNPRGARVYLDGEPVGTTPYHYSDTKILGTTTEIRLEAEGYEPFYTYMTRNEEVDAGAVVGGLFFMFPFLWTMKYKPSRTFEMIPLGANEAQPVQATAPAAAVVPVGKSNVERLRELKQMLDEKLITQQEYDATKKKILEDIK